MLTPMARPHPSYLEVPAPAWLLLPSSQGEVGLCALCPDGSSFHRWPSLRSIVRLLCFSGQRVLFELSRHHWSGSVISRGVAVSMRKGCQVPSTPHGTLELNPFVNLELLAIGAQDLRLPLPSLMVPGMGLEDTLGTPHFSSAQGGYPRETCSSQR